MKCVDLYFRRTFISVWIFQIFNNNTSPPQILIQGRLHVIIIIKREGLNVIQAYIQHYKFKDFCGTEQLINFFALFPHFDEEEDMPENR